MGFNQGRGGGGGGKKGPRKMNGSFKNKAKLRPQPFMDPNDAQPANEQSSKRHKSSKAMRERSEEHDGEESDGNDEDDTFGYREGLLEEKKPFDGFNICVTGLSDTKARLLEGARALGATTDSNMSDATTHLIAEAPVGQKYNVSSRSRVLALSLTKAAANALSRSLSLIP
jgi:NAD-dependent DNA ligase